MNSSDSAETIDYSVLRRKFINPKPLKEVPKLQTPKFDIEIDFFKEKKIPTLILEEEDEYFDQLSANFSSYQVQLPQVVDNPVSFEVNWYKEKVKEKFEYGEEPYTYIKLKEKPKEVFISSERFEISPNYQKSQDDEIEEVPYNQIKIVPVPEESVVDRIIKLPTVRTTTKVNPVIKRIPRKRIVRVEREKIVPKFVYIEEEMSQEYPISLKKYETQLVINEYYKKLDLKNHVVRETVNNEQHIEFEKGAELLSKLQFENKALQHTLLELQKQRELLAPITSVEALQEEQEDLESSLSTLKEQLRKRTKVHESLRKKFEEEPRVKLNQIIDEDTKMAAEATILRLKEKNEELCQFLNRLKAQKVQFNKAQDLYEEQKMFLLNQCSIALRDDPLRGASDEFDKYLLLRNEIKKGEHCIIK